MARQLSNKQLLLAKYGGTPTAGDVVTLGDYAFVNPTPASIDYKDVGLGVLGSQKSVINDDLTTVDISATANLRGNGGGATAPKIGEMLKICGLEEIIDTANDNVTYQPADVFPNTGTLISYLDGTKRTIEGVVGNLKIDFTVGEIAKATFELKGFTDLEPTLEANPAVTLDTNGLFIVKSVSAVTIAGNTIPLKSGSLDFGMDIQQIYAIGNKEYATMDYAPTFTIEQIKERGNESHWADIKMGALKEVQVQLTNADGNTFTFIASNTKLKEVGEKDDSGIVGVSRTYRLERSDTEPNYKLIYA